MPFDIGTAKIHWTVEFSLIEAGVLANLYAVEVGLPIFGQKFCILCQKCPIIVAAPKFTTFKYRFPAKNATLNLHSIENSRL